MNIVLIGPPGSGKSAIGKMLALSCDMDYISSGDIARELAETDQETRDNLAVGKMACESKMRDVMHDKVVSAHKSFILDGFPRTREQYEWLMDRTRDVVVMHIYVPILTCVHRLDLRGRADDNPYTIMKRLDFYNEQTMQIFKVAKNAHSVDGNRETADIVRDIMMILGRWYNVDSCKDRQI